MSKDEQVRVEFESRWQYIAPGALVGLIIAVAVPAVVLAWGKAMPGWMQGLAVIMAVLIGGAVALTSIFFGIIIPTKVDVNENAPKTDRKHAPEPADASAPGDPAP